MWELLHPAAVPEDLGYLPGIIMLSDPRPASEQIAERYSYGGGWSPFPGHALGDDNSLTYPKDPTLYPLARLQLRDELVLLYPHSWVAVIQPDRSFAVCRMD